MLGRRQTIAVLVVCTALKVAVAAAVVGTVEVRQMRQQAEAAVAGRDVLDPASTGSNPSFFPSGHYALVAGAWALATTSGLPFSFLIKLPAILADLALSGLLLAASPPGGASGVQGETLALAYMASPVTLLLSAYHGQLHTVAVAAAVLALWMVPRGAAAGAGAVLAVAASVRQHFAVVAVPLALTLPGPRRWRFLGAAIATGLALNFGLIASAHPARVLAPTWVYGAWGYGLLLQQGPRLLKRLGLPSGETVAVPLTEFILQYGWLVPLAWTALFVAACLRAERRGAPLEPWRATLVFLAGLCALSPGFGAQWAVWVLPFWLVVDLRSGLLYSWVAGAFLAGSYWQWTLPRRHGVESITAHLDLLSRAELLGIVAVAGLSLATWALMIWAAWRFSRVTPARAGA